MEQFLPLYCTRRFWSDRIQELELPLFRGYVFCRFPLSYRTSVLRTEGIRSIVKFGNVPVPISDKEIEDIKILTVSRRPLLPLPYLTVGQSVRVIDGPLRNLEGVLVRVKDSWRLAISVFLLQRSVTVEIDRTAVVSLRNSDSSCFSPSSDRPGQ
jgi:transcription antitermination factor NusG